MAKERWNGAEDDISLCKGFEISEYKGLLLLQFRSGALLRPLALVRADECRLCDALQHHLAQTGAGTVISLKERAH